MCEANPERRGIHSRAGLLSAGCGRTGDFTIHDAEDGVSLLAGWAVEQRQQRAANSGDGKQKLVRRGWPDMPPMQSWP